MQRAAIIAFILFSIVLFSGGFMTGTFPQPVTKTGLINVGVTKMDSNLVIFGINPVDHSFEADMYDPQLRVVHQRREIIRGYTSCELKLHFQDEQKLEFILTNTQNQKQKFNYLDQNLDSIYQSDWSVKPVLLVPAQIHIIDQFRSNQHYWEIRTEWSTDSAGRSVQLTYLYQNDISLSSSGPLNVLKRTYILDSMIVETARVFLERDNKVYMYMNESTLQGKQYVLCINIADGKLLYKTELSVNYSDFNFPEKSSPADACIYSNYYWDTRTNRLMIAGTWIADTLESTGLFLVQLDGTGKITGSATDYGAWLTNYVDYDARTGFAGFSAIEEAFYRVVKMGYLPNGKFAVFSETYGRKLLSVAGKFENVAFADDFHHYFCPEVELFSLTPTSIKLNNEQAGLKGIKWDVNHHLDSIAGYIRGSTMLDDERFGIDPSIICSNLRGQHYLLDACFDKQSRMKVLMQDTVVITPGKKSNDYFCKTLGYPLGANCLAFISPNPVHQQNFAERNDYFTIDFNRLYRLHLAGNTYELSVIHW